MPFALGIVTVLALLMTIGMGVVTWRLVRGERRRSAARVSALTDELRKREADRSRPSPVEPTPEVPTVPADIPLQPAPPHVSTGPVPAGSATATGLFQTRTEETGSWVRRLAGFGVAAAVLVTLVSAAILTFPSSRHNNAAIDELLVPIELLALTHQHQDGMLAISGMVRNPGNRQAEHHLTVMALALDDDGTVVATGRAPLASDSLPAGTESTFAVSLPADDATRYRISFLFEETTVPHLDRRMAPAVSAPQAES